MVTECQSGSKHLDFLKSILRLIAIDGYNLPSFGLVDDNIV